MSNPRRLGRVRPVAHGPRLRMSRYLTAALPPPPASVDYTSAARAPLSQMYLNDQLGDCVIAGMAHLVGLFTGNAGGTPVVLSNAQILALYEAIGGYNPSDPNSDQGCDEVTALNYWQQHGAPAGSHQISGWLAIDPTNRVEVEQAMYLFENLFFGIELPDAWVNVQSSGFVWDAGTPDPNNGHAVVGVGYNAQGVQIATWGMIGTMTWAALQRDVIAQSGGELYAVISPDTISKASAKAPSGFNWSQLVADFDALGGHVPAPAPTPPAPPPAPPAPTPPAPPAPTVPTRAQVLAVLNAIAPSAWPHG